MAKTSGRSKPITALAVGAHPDDIEFMMAGTLILLRQAGVSIHMWNLANGNCGTATHSRRDIIRLRGEEARHSADLVDAVLHPPLVDDIMIYFEPSLTARVAAVVRKIKPTILLIPSPGDYMEDHQNTCRLLVTAAFVRGMSGFATTPPVAPWNGDVVLYHALPYGLRDGLRQLARPGQYVNIAPVLSRKREMLAQHRTQKEWLDVSQGVDAYLTAMEDMCRQVGTLSGKFACAEGWRRHSHLGFCPEGADPLSDILGPACTIDQQYERSLG